MKSAQALALVAILFAAAARADVVSDYMVKVVDGSPSYPAILGSVAGSCSPVSDPGWGAAGGPFRLYGAQISNYVVHDCTYDDDAMTLVSNAWSDLQVAGGGGLPSGRKSAYNDYATGNQITRLWCTVMGWDTNNPCWGGRFCNMYYSSATESSGVTFATPTRVTIVNTSMMQTNPVGNSLSWTVGNQMLDGGYLFMDQDDMWDLCGYVTSLRSLPGDLWENIDESQDIGSWYSAFGQPDDDHYNWGGGGILRLCDNTIASAQASSSPWISAGGGPGIGLWINTVADSLPGNTPVWDGWRNDPNNTTSRSLDMMLLGESTYSQLAGTGNTRQMARPCSPLSLEPRHKDSSTQWLAMYTGAWPSTGLGFFKLMITKQKGDLNYDGKCDFADLPLFSGTFNKSLGDDGYLRDADFTGDDKVDFNDLPALSGYYGQACQ